MGGKTSKPKTHKTLVSGSRNMLTFLIVFFLLNLLMNAHCVLDITSRDRPNIVMIMSDAFDGRLTFQPGNKVVQLPYINYMRQLGSLFLNSYTNSPICCPSRAAMWSGQFVHLTQSWNNYKCLDPNATTWMEILGKSGYHSHSMGKQDYTSGHHSLSNRVEAWTRNVPFLLTQEGRPVTDLVGDASTKRVMVKDWNTTDAAVQWIQNTASSLTEPFALYLGLNLPHPYQTESLGPTAGGSTFRTSPYWLTKASSLTLHRFLFKVSYNQVSVPKWLRFEDMHPVDYYSTFTKNCSGPFTEEEIRRIRAFYYAMCAEADSMLGEVLGALRDGGLLNRTVIIFTSDHGDLAMEHRQFYKMSMFEGSSHVPLLMMGPGVKPGKEISVPVSLVDIYPTVLVHDHSAELRPSWIFSEYHGCNANASTYMLRIHEWKYITYADGMSVHPQLFNLSEDESELRNVASRFPEVCQELDKLLRSIVDYPSVSQNVQNYNKQQFLQWRRSLGDSYTHVIANLRWH
ncbi:hypothetical protein DNTS_013424, partial [Danionella cerebrum]